MTRISLAERTTQGARGATQLGGVTQDVETYSLQAGSFI